MQNRCRRRDGDGHRFLWGPAAAVEEWGSISMVWRGGSCGGRGVAACMHWGCTSGGGHLIEICSQPFLLRATSTGMVPVKML